jgi:predicted glycosyltransferase
MKKKVFFYVQHLLGIGHLKRAAVLAQALKQAGFEVTLASGGLPVPGIDVLQLPPVQSPDFTQLLDGHGRPVDDAWKRGRTAFLLAEFEKAKADALIVELFPFGRRQLRFELLPLLEEAADALVVCSVRDLIQPRPEREAEVLATFDRYFDHVLVHGDERVASFDLTFGLAPRLAGRLHYTGYVVAQAAATGDAGAGEVLVSAGGGAVGRRLLETALEARALSSLRNRSWRVLAGVNSKKLPSFQDENVIVEPARNDFTLRLRNCVLSVSQGGYNTVMETLQAGARAVLVPYAGAGESEQALRARMLSHLFEVVDESALTPKTLAAAIDRAAARGRPSSRALDLGGAARSAALLREWLS